MFLPAGILRRTFTFTVFLTCFRYSDASMVSVDQGTLLGSTSLSRNGRTYDAFLGVPFAKPPVGDLRFEPPQPPECWKGVRNATKLAPVCIQKELFVWFDDTLKIEGDEDCLYLNVYKPAETANNSLPVIVYLHGGAFITGKTGSYNPMYFMDHDVIVVTITYRLNALGFLSTVDQVLPGNNGMKDQVMALRWIQKNIAAFGGNPSKVTIYGTSAGAASVHLHMHSPLSRGLFHRAIAQSGSALAPWVFIPYRVARKRALTLGTLAGCPTTSSREMVACLKNVPARELVLAHNKLYVWDRDPLLHFGVVYEPAIVRDAFIRKNPWYQDEINRVPLLIGFVSEEGILKSARYLDNNGEKLQYLNEHYKRMLPISLFYAELVESKEKIDQITESIKKFYFADKDLSTKTSTELTKLYTDKFFAYDLIETAKRRKKPTFFYYYNHKNKYSLASYLGEVEEDLGICHQDDLISFFQLKDVFSVVNEGDDFEVSKKMVKYWVNFAANGNPDPKKVWTPVKSEAVEYLHITTKKDEMKVGLAKESYEFWKSLNITPPRT